MASADRMDEPDVAGALAWVAAAIAERREEWTPRRVNILRVIAAHGGHMTAEDIRRAAQTRDPSVAMSTVYRCVNLLAEVGVLVRIDLPGLWSVYEWTFGREPHAHLVDPEDGSITDLRDPSVTAALADSAARLGYEIAGHNVIVFGRRLRPRDTGSDGSWPCAGVSVRRTRGGRAAHASGRKPRPA